MPQKAAGQSFHIGSLMLHIALYAILLAVGRFAPGLAIFLLIPSAIGLIRTQAEARKAGERRMTLLWHVGVFLAAFGITIAIFIAAGVAFFLTCLGIVSTGRGANGEEMFGFGLMGGTIAGIAVCVWLFTLYYRMQRQETAREAPPSQHQT